MDLSNAKERYEKAKGEKGIHSFVHEIAKSLWEFSGKKDKFGLWLGAVKNCGIDHARNILKVCKEKGINDNHYLLKCLKK